MAGPRAAPPIAIGLPPALALQRALLLLHAPVHVLHYRATAAAAAALGPHAAPALVGVHRIHHLALLAGLRLSVHFCDGAVLAAGAQLLLVQDAFRGLLGLLQLLAHAPPLAGARLRHLGDGARRDVAEVQLDALQREGEREECGGVWIG